jgi:hypothetical protein
LSKKSRDAVGQRARDQEVPMIENPRTGSEPLVRTDFGPPWTGARWALLVFSLSIYFVAIAAFLGRHPGRQLIAAPLQPAAVAAESSPLPSLASEEDGCGVDEGCLVIIPGAPSKAALPAAVRRPGSDAQKARPARRQAKG